ncbi:MAG: hypothetical protein QXT28_09070 [Thermofilaceae archaeon]
MRSEVVEALRKLLEMHKGRTATVRVKHVVLVLHGLKPYIRNGKWRTHPYERYLVLNILREVAEVEGWRLKKVEYRSGWVFVYRR